MTVLAVAGMIVVSIAVIHRIQVTRNAGALARLARAKQQEGKSTDAMGLYARYLAYQPDDAAAQAEFARLLIEFAELPTATKNDRTFAYSRLETAVRKNPDDLLLRKRLADWMLRFNRPGDAIKELNILRERLVAGRPGNTEQEAVELDAIDVLRARAFVGSGRFEAAATAAAAVIGFDLKTKAFKEGAEPKTGINAHEASILLANLLETKLKSPDSGLVVLEHLTTSNPEDVEAWLALAGWHSSHGNMAKAAAAFRIAAKIAPDDPNVVFADLEMSLSEKRYEAAEQIATRARTLFPNDERTFRALASSAMQRQDVEKAISVLREGLEAQPGQPVLLRMLADILLQRGRLDEAEETIDTFVELHGDKRPPVGMLQARLMMARKRWLPAQQKLESIRPLAADSDQLTRQIDLMLGQCYEMLGQFDAQLAAHQRVLLGDYNSLAARIGVATALASSGKPDAARAEFEAIAAAIPPERLTKIPEVWYPLIQLRIADQMKRPPANRDWSPVERLLDSLEQSPVVSDSQLVLLRSDLLVRKGDAAAAFEILRKHVDANPSNPQTLAALVLLVLREQGPAAAQEVLEKAPAAIAEDQLLLSVGAQLAAQLPAEESAAALAHLEQKALDMPDEQQVRLLSTIASIHRGMGDQEPAERVWRTAIRQRPDDLLMRTALFELACEQGDVEKAQAGADEINRLSGPTSPHGRVAQAATMVLAVRVSQAKKTAATTFATDLPTAPDLSPDDNKQLDAAKNLLIEAENDRPGWAQIQQLFAEVASLQGDLPTAIERLQRATRLGPANPAVIRQLVALLYGSDRLEEAQQALAMVGPDGLNGLERISAEIDLKAGQFDNAVAMAERSLAGSRKNSAGDLLWFGQLLARAGKIDRASEVLQQAVDAEPQRPEGWIALLLIQNATGQRQAAELTLEKAARILPSPQRQLFAAQGHELLGRIDDAERSFREAINEAPDNPAALRSLAAFLVRQGRLAEAREELRAIIAATRPDFATKQTQQWARRMLAELIAQTGRYPDIERALALLDANANAEGSLPAEDLALQAGMLASRPEPSSWQRSLDLFDRLTSLQPLSNAQRSQKALLLEQLGRWEECRDELLSIASAPNTPPPMLALLIEKLVQHKELSAARIWLKTLADRFPDAPFVVALQAKLSLAENDRAAAVEAARKLMPGESPTPEVAGQLGALSALLEDLGLSAAADKVFTQFAAASSDGLIARAGFLGRAQRVDEALDLLEGSWDELPLENLLRTASAVLGSQSANVTQQQMERVGRWFEKAHRQDPDSSALTLLFADFLATTGRIEDAVAAYRALWDRKDLPPQQAAVVANNLAYHLAEPKTAAEAEKLVAFAIAELGPQPDVLDTRGVVLLAAGKGKDALTDIKTSILVPTASKYIHLAAALASQDQFDAARQAVAEAKKLGFVTRQLFSTDQRLLKSLEAALAK
jgi:predicted Zn-dependent protease